MKWLMTLLVVLLLGAACAQAPMSALVLTGGGLTMDKQVAKRLKEEGFTVVVRSLHEPISLAQLQLFELVILPDFEGLAAPPIMSVHVINYLNAKRNLATLRQYVAEGGGVFISPLMTGGGAEVAENCNILLQTWGASILAAQVRDDAHAAGNKLPYAWTTQIGKAPVTADVARLYYPTNQLRWDDAYATVPIVLDDTAWTAVVRGMPGSVAAKGLHYTTWLPVPGQTAPVLAAVRPAGKGRVALFGVGSFYTLAYGYLYDERGWIGESNTGLIDGILLEKGEDEAHPSDGMTLLLNTFRWLGDGARATGCGGYTAARLKELPAPPAETYPAWLNWTDAGGATPHKVLLGARSAYSDGTGAIAEWAAAAKAAGYRILVMTETFEKLPAKRWDAFVRDCQAASTPELIVMPGIDIADTYGTRYLVFGQHVYPEPFMLTDDGKFLKQTQYLSLGFGTHCTAIHRPTTAPLPYQMLKFFSGVVVYTYRGGKLVDDGLLPYQWYVNNISVPLPLVAHECYAPTEVAAIAAGDAHQLYILADTPENAAWYLRPGMRHFWESPTNFLVSAGPMIRTLSGDRLVADDDVPITEVRLISNYATERRWTPKEQRIDLSVTLPPSHLRSSFFYLADAKGRTAITPTLRIGPGYGYNMRCSDRQNFFGVAVNYTGTRLPDVDVLLPTFGTLEGRGFWPAVNGPRRGENLAPQIEFPYFSPALSVTDANLDLRYWGALWEEVAYDAKGTRGTTRSRVYDGRVRYYDFHYEPYEVFKGATDRTMMVIQVDLRLRMPVEPADAVFPAFTSVGPQPAYGIIDPETGQRVTGKLTKGCIDLPVGGYAGDLIALTPGLRVDARGQVGFANDEQAGALPAGTAWSARYVKAPKGKVAAMRVLMGFTADTPYGLTLTRGTLGGVAYLATTTAKDGGIAGTVKPAPAPAATLPTDPSAEDAIDDAPKAVPMTYPLPLAISGVNPNWHAAVWREDGSLTPFGVFERVGYARLDVTKGGRFYAGNLVTAARAPALRITVLAWDAAGISLELNNPTDAPIETTLATPVEISGKFRLNQQVSVPSGSMKRVEYK